MYFATHYAHYMLTTHRGYLVRQLERMADAALIAQFATHTHHEPHVPLLASLPQI